MAKGAQQLVNFGEMISSTNDSQIIPKYVRSDKKHGLFGLYMG